jgi:hypothetical protein
VYVRVLCRSKEPPVSAVEGSTTVAFPNAAYPAAVDDKGKKFCANSKVDETEYERPSLVREDSFKGSSSSNDRWRDDGAREDSSEDRCDDKWVEEANDASSNESLAVVVMTALNPLS